LAAELYGPHCLLYDYGGWAIPLEEAVSCTERFGWESLLLKDRTQAGEEGREKAAILAGNPPERLQVREGPLRFLVEPQHPRNVGLFLDTRGLRTWLRENASGAVLNLFCYTGSLGLAALAGGADSVIQVDISKRYLDWGRDNLGGNSLPADRCRFQRMDGESYLDWAAKKGLRFRHILLDPPVFSRFEGRVFRFETDYFRLASKAAALLAPEGILHAVTNFAGVSAPEFQFRLEQAITGTGRKLSDLRRLPLPSDFDLAGFPGERAEGNALIFQAGLG
jgi:23S rRNA (cytosine1962-C5)-methyltransferase